MNLPQALRHYRGRGQKVIQLDWRGRLGARFVLCTPGRQPEILSQGALLHRAGCDQRKITLAQLKGEMTPAQLRHRLEKHGYQLERLKQAPMAPHRLDKRLCHGGQSNKTGRRCWRVTAPSGASDDFTLRELRFHGSRLNSTPLPL